MKIQKILIPVAAALLALTLTACAPLEFEEYPNGTPQTTAVQLAAEGEDALPVETQLILGTLLLEGMDQAVDAQQAAVLLPLWQKWHDLNRSNTVAPADRDALLEQIQSAMTEAQIQAMAAMNLTLQDIFTYIDKNGLGFPSQPDGNPEDENPGGEISTETPSVEDLGGTPSPDNDDFPLSDLGQTQTLSPDEFATVSPDYQDGFGGSHGPEWVLLHALIDLLESKQPTESESE
jgi:hypothetical protein